MSNGLFVTPLYAGLLALWFLLLSLRVVLHRRRAKVSLGDGGDTLLARAIRGHANFAEYVPLALLMMAMLELVRTSIYVLHVLGILLLVGRLLHGYAFSFTAHFRFGRTAGTALTIAVIVTEAVLCIYQAWRGHLVW
jgi:uncharacterized membrane protein YecN with MAPEG domain